MVQEINQEGKPRSAEEHQKGGAFTGAGGRSVSKQHFDEQVGEAVDEADAWGIAGGQWRSLGPIQQFTMLCGCRIDFELVMLMATVGILLKIMHIMRKKIEITRNAMDWLRMKARERRMHVRIRAQEQARTGIYFESDGGEESEEEEFQLEDEMHIRMVTSEDAGGDNMEQEEQHESEPAEEDREVDVNDYDYAMDVKLEGGCGAEHLPEEASEDEMEEVEIEADIPEEPEEEDYETDYGSVALAMEDEEVYRDLDPESYDEYRWECLGNAVGVGHYVLKKRDVRAHADPTCSSTWWPGGAHQGGGLLEREAPLHDAL